MEAENKDYGLNSFINMLCQDVEGQNDHWNGKKEDWEAYRKSRVTQIRKTLRLDAMKERYAAPLKYETDKEWKQQGIKIVKYAVNVMKNLSMPVYILEPDRENPREIVFLNGHDPLGAMGAFTRSTEENLSLPMEMARQGYRVYIPELFGYGEAKHIPTNDACASCGDVNRFLNTCGYSILAVRLIQAEITLDFAEKFHGGSAFLTYGVSGGGHLNNFFSAIDDRVEGAIISCFCNTYEDSIYAIQHCVCNYPFEQLTLGESYEITSLCAPRKLLTLNGRQDPIFPLKGSQTAFSYLAEHYRKQQATDCYKWVLYDGGHEINKEEVMTWLRENFA